jgi:hypothetical protein
MDIIAYSKGAAAQKIAESKVQYYSQEAEPANVQVGDQWYVPSTGKTYERQSDGTTEVWFDVSPSATVQSLDSEVVTNSQGFTAVGGTPEVFTMLNPYIPGAVEVYRNGYLLTADDYTATDSNTVSCNTNAGDYIYVVAFGIFQAADHYTKNEADVLLADKAAAADVAITRNTNVTVTVGSGGDYATINEALEYLTETYTPAYTSNGFTATVSLLAGFVMAEQVLVSGVDLGWITISGVDAETTITRSTLITSFEGRTPAFGGKDNATLPVIRQQFNMDTSGIASNQTGIYLTDNSTAIFASGGIKNAGREGIFLRHGSSIIAPSCDFSGALNTGLCLLYNCTASAYGINISNSGNYGICCVNNSTVDAQLADCSGAGADGVYASQTSMVNFDDGDASGAFGNAIYAIDGSTINARLSTATGAGNNGVYAVKGSVINANNTNASNAGSRGVYASSGSTIEFQSGVATNVGRYGVQASSMAFVNARSSNCTCASYPEYYIELGGFIVIDGAVGDTTTSTAVSAYTDAGAILD